MDECKNHNEIVGEIKKFHLEIKERLARIETKQDIVGSLNERFENEIMQLHMINSQYGREIATLNTELKNIKWTAGIVAGTVTGLVQFLFMLLKGGK